MIQSTLHLFRIRGIRRRIDLHYGATRMSLRIGMGKADDPQPCNATILNDTAANWKVLRPWRISSLVSAQDKFTSETNESRSIWAPTLVFK